MAIWIKTVEPCPRCDGKGKIEDYPFGIMNCWDCAGSGETEGRMDLEKYLDERLLAEKVKAHAAGRMER